MLFGKAEVVDVLCEDEGPVPSQTTAEVGIHLMY